MSREIIKSIADFGKEARALVDKGELEPEKIGAWVRERIKLQNLQRQEEAKVAKEKPEIQDEFLDETEEQPIEELVSEQPAEPPRKKNKMRILLTKSLTFLMTSTLVLNAKIGLNKVLVLLILVFLFFISQQLSDIKKELRPAALILKRVNPEQDIEIGLLTSEELDFALLTPKEQIERWNTMSPNQKIKYAHVFRYCIDHYYPFKLGIAVAEVVSLYHEAKAIEQLNPR
jgi:hypothetical protein